MQIEIEKMMFGDYRVQVWNSNLSSELDREYFCRGFDSALLTALNIRTMPLFKNLEIFSREGDQLQLIDKK